MILELLQKISTNINTNDVNFILNFIEIIATVAVFTLIHISASSSIRNKRWLAILYIKNYFEHATYAKDEDSVKHSGDKQTKLQEDEAMWDQIMPFIKQIHRKHYFDEVDGNVKSKKIKELKKQIKIGVFDGILSGETYAYYTTKQIYEYSITKKELTKVIQKLRNDVDKIQENLREKIVDSSEKIDEIETQIEILSDKKKK